MTEWKEFLPPRVAKGAELLDRLSPQWWEKVATDRLAMQSCSRCILGQIYGNYFEGCVTLNRADPVEFRKASPYGFALTDDEQWIGAYETASGFKALADLWRAEIRKRLEADR